MSQDSRGHIPALYTRSFCLRVRGHASILQSIASNFNIKEILCLDRSDGISICSPRNLTPSGVKGIDWSSRKSAGSIILPLDACKPRFAHLGILAFMPDQ